MKLIVGLGNPDAKYKNTFHNLGFMCVDSLAEKLSVSFNKDKCRALVAETFINGEKIIIAKPQTYMNLSGESVRELLSFYKIDLADMIVAFDDYDVAQGTIRIRESGSAGTHNGMRNIISEIKSQDFKRLRVGFKPKEQTEIPLINLVLKGISKEDSDSYKKIISRASDCLMDFAYGKNFSDIMQKYNGKAD